LDPTIVSYHIANEGRRLIGCDRLSVAIREAKKAKIEAVSGADVVEKRSSQIQLMRKLADAVFNWDEKLVYRGAKDDGLPPDVYHALDEYLAQGRAKLLISQPLHDTREFDKDTKEQKPQRSRSALLMECFEPPQQPEPLLARLDVIGRHASTALYNAVEMRKIPLALLWKPILRVQEGLGGRAKLYTYLGVAAATLLILAMIFVPYELKMDAKGQLVPQERLPVYASHAGFVQRINVEPLKPFARGQVMLEMFDPELQGQMLAAKHKLADALGTWKALNSQLANTNVQDRAKLELDRVKADSEITAAKEEIRRRTQTFQADADNPGQFSVRSPEFDPKQPRRREPRWLTINGNDYRTELQGRYIKPSDAVLRLGEIEGIWEIEIRIPEKN